MDGVPFALHPKFENSVSSSSNVSTQWCLGMGRRKKCGIEQGRISLEDFYWEFSSKEVSFSDACFVPLPVVHLTKISNCFQKRLGM